MKKTPAKGEKKDLLTKKSIEEAVNAKHEMQGKRGA